MPSQERRPFIGPSLAVAFVLAGCSSPAPDQPQSRVVAADDGSATLTIPAGALPDGVTLDDITITRDDSGASASHGEVARWVLEPAGLQLSKPVTLELLGNIAPGKLISVLHHGETTLEAPSPDFDANEDGSIPSLRVSVDHFSTILRYLEDYPATLAWEAAPAAIFEVSDTTQPRLQVTRPLPLDYQIIDSGTSILVSLDPEWSASVTWLISENLTRAGRTDAVSGSGDTRGAYEDVQCAEPNDAGEIGAIVSPKYDAEMTTTLSNGTQEAMPIQVDGPRQRIQNANKCLAKREEKPEYAAVVVDLSSARIRALEVPSTDSVDLGTSGKYGFLVALDPGQTLSVKVTDQGFGSAVTYYPKYPPGFDFTDPAAGVTTVFNKDLELPNFVLVVIEGQGVVSIEVTDASN